MLTRAMALPRRLLHGGVAGDARAAGGRQIASNVVVQLVARAITMAISVVTVSLTARTLHPNGYGVWSGVSSYIALFSVLTDLGFTTAAMQRMAAEPEREGEWLGALAVSRTAFSFVVMAICAAAVPLLLSDSGHRHAIAFILTVTILSTGSTALMAVFQSRLRAGLVLAFTILQGVLWLGAVLALAFTHASVVQFAIAYTLVIGVVAILQVAATERRVHIAWRAGRRLWRPLLRVALPLGIASILITVYYQVDSVLLLQIAGAREAGVYGAAYAFLSPLAFLPAAVMSSFFPVLSAVHRDDPPRVRRLVQIAAETMAVISLPILAGTIALSDQIVRLLYGPAFARSGSAAADPDDRLRLDLLWLACRLSGADPQSTVAACALLRLGCRRERGLEPSVDTPLRRKWIGLGNRRNGVANDDSDARDGPVEPAHADYAVEAVACANARCGNDRRNDARPATGPVPCRATWRSVLCLGPRAAAYRGRRCAACAAPRAATSLTSAGRKRGSLASSAAAADGPQRERTV